MSIFLTRHRDGDFEAYYALYFTLLAGKQPFGVLLIRQLCGGDDDDDDGDVCDCVGNQISLYCLIDNA